MIVDRESDWRRGRIKEAIYINAFNPGERIDRILNIEKGFEIDDSWKAYNTAIKSTVSRKIEFDSAFEEG